MNQQSGVGKRFLDSLIIFCKTLCLCGADEVVSLSPSLPATPPPMFISSLVLGKLTQAVPLS